MANKGGKNGKGGYVGKVDVIGTTKAPFPQGTGSRKGASVITGKDLRAGKGK
jgi:hypothetical protein